MRIIEEKTYPNFRLSILYWNNKYLIKAESGLLEQTFKVPETEVTGVADLQEMLTQEWITQVENRFKDMGSQLQTMLNPY